LVEIGVEAFVFGEGVVEGEVEERRFVFGLWFGGHGMTLA